MIIGGIPGLIGDALGTFPLLMELSRTKEIEVISPQSKPVDELLALIEHENLKVVKEATPEITLDLGEAFQYGAKHNLYMSQCYHHQLGLSDPKLPPKISLETDGKSGFVDTNFVVLAPFSRSLPIEQKWPQTNWQELVNSLPDTKFIIVGASQYDPRKFVQGANVTEMYDLPMSTLIDVIKASKSVISVVTGISHMAYHLTKDNWLFVNQGAWGKNPEGMCFTKYIPTITTKEVIDKICG